MELELRLVGMLMFALIVCLWFVLRPMPGETWQLSLVRYLAILGGISLPVLIATILCITWQADRTLTKFAQSFSGLVGMLLTTYLIGYLGDSREESDEQPDVVE